MQRRHIPLGNYSYRSSCLFVLITAMMLCFISSTINEAYARRNFYIERPRLGMELSSEYEQDETEGPHVSRRDSSTTYTEELTLETSGWIYHPAFLSYTLEISPAWEQHRRTNSDINESRSFLNNYRAELDFLQYKPYSLSLSASRATNTVNSNFAQRTRGTTDTYSALFSLKYPILPTSLLYQHSENERTGFFQSSHKHDEVALDIRHYKYLGTSKLRGIYRDSSDFATSRLRETYYLSTSFDNTVDLSKSIDLVSNASYEETDETDMLLRRYSVYETLNMTHSKSLSTGYSLSYNRDNRFVKLSNESFRSQNKSAGFHLHHKLYENLDTNVRLTSNEYNYTTGRESLHDASIDWNYSRRIPWGTLGTNVGYSYLIRDQKVRDIANTTFLVQDEAKLFDLLSNSVELDNNDIVQSTISVTEKAFPDGLGIIYSEGTDYTIQVEGRKTKIIRLAGSTIPVGATFYVHYRYVRTPAFDYEMLGQRYGVNLYLWSALRAYYNLTRQSQDLISGIPSEELTNDTVHAAGGELELKFSRTSLDWEDEYTTSSPKKSWSAYETILLRPGNMSFIQLTARYRKTNYKESDDEQKSRNFSVTFERRLTPRSNMLIEGSILDISGHDQDITNSEFLTEYTLQYRIWELTLRYIFSNDEDHNVDAVFRNHYFIIKLKRELF